MLSGPKPLNSEMKLSDVAKGTTVVKRSQNLGYLTTIKADRIGTIQSDELYAAKGSCSKCMVLVLFQGQKTPELIHCNKLKINSSLLLENAPI